MEDLTFWQSLGLFGLVIISHWLISWFIGTSQIRDELIRIRKLLEKNNTPKS